MVEIGLYLHQVPDVDLHTNSYLADFYLWFLWKGDIDPTKSFEFMNGVAPSELTKTSTFVDDAGADKPEVLPDGCNYQVLRVHGRFGHPFVIADYPGDEQDLVISIEDAKDNSKELVYKSTA